MADTQILASQYNGWYSTLDTIRSSHGLSKYSRTVTQNQTATLLSQISQLQTDINNTQSETHISASVTAASVSIPVPSANSTIALSLKTKVDSILSLMSGICHHNPCSYNYSSCNSDYGDNGDCRSDTKYTTDNTGKSSGCSNYQLGYGY